MATLTDTQLQALVSAAGFPASSQATAVAVALAESGGITTIVSGTGDYGVFQINHRAHPTYDTGKLLKDPAYNAAAAFSISSGGTDWSPWSAYKNGSYRKFLPRAQAAAKAAGVSNKEGTPPTTAGGVLAGQVAGMIPGGGLLEGLLSGGSAVAGAAGGAVDFATGGWVDDLVKKSYEAILTLLLATAGAGIATLGLSRLMSASGATKKIQQAASTAGTVAAAGASGGASLAAGAAATAL